MKCPEGKEVGKTLPASSTSSQSSSLINYGAGPSGLQKNLRPRKKVEKVVEESDSDLEPVDIRDMPEPFDASSSDDLVPSDEESELSSDEPKKGNRYFRRPSASSGNLQLK